ncbi:hypothetical protein L1F30_16030 [Simiduia sp. 21SJ11W-1]|uniref:hypothetical protein n=1 Tax=Simiduia sp. 21SJ11W-1 TaxID=2909669 RepID=UPI00209F34E8|nr:hypothetical protein [Simiduia sp. 21SJ11W-1]UTA47650.1 hypothetical protein L1F30_16030 [Simiduia sp. 21SJ11W-1]
MGIPVSYFSPIADCKVRQLTQLRWEWICWLKQLRTDIEAGAFKSTTEDLNDTLAYFECFQRADGYINLGDSYEMPSDARVDFIYIPTALACAIINLLNLDIKDKRAQQFLKITVRAASGRKFRGSGYEADPYLAFTLEIFAWGNLLQGLFKDRWRHTKEQALLFDTYVRLTDLLIDPDKATWGSLDADWIKHCLRLMNCTANNYSLLKISPLAEEFKRTFQYIDLLTALYEGSPND